MLFRKKKVKELNKNGQIVTITLGTLFGVGMGTAAMFSTFSTYELAEKLVGNKKHVKAGCEEEEDD